MKLTHAMAELQNKLSHPFSQSLESFGLLKVLDSVEVGFEFAPHGKCPTNDFWPKHQRCHPDESWRYHPGDHRGPWHAAKGRR
jgi:hypothetical protein